MLVKMICGTYGYRDGKGILIPKDKEAGEFEVTEAEAERLIDSGRAVKVENELDCRLENQGGLPDPCSATEQFEKMGIKEIRQIAKDMGIPNTGSKEELVKRITSTTREVSDKDEIPSLEAAEPEE